MTPGHFLATHQVFTREELTRAIGKPGEDRSPATVSSHLLRWRHQGRMARVKRGLYVRTDPGDSAVPLYPVACRMAPDAALGYHTALEVHGYAQSPLERLYFVTWTKTKPVTFGGRPFIPVRPRVALRRKGRPHGWIDILERGGLTIRVTTLERTFADILDRPDVAGGLEEAWRSCCAIPGLDLDELESYVTTLSSRVLAAKVGFFLERRREELAVSEALLKRLQARAPAVPVYLERGRRGRVVARWNLVAPPELLAGEWESAA